MVRALVQELADDVARGEGREPVAVPDLGPAVVMDQLTVMVHDATAVAVAADLPAVGARLRTCRLALT